jgi:hypothetical protein
MTVKEAPPKDLRAPAASWQLRDGKTQPQIDADFRSFRTAPHSAIWTSTPDPALARTDPLA